MNAAAASTVDQLPSVKKPHSVRELGTVDLSSIKPLVLSLPDKLWTVEDSRKENQFPCFHHTRHIIFRFIEGNRDPRIFYSHPIWEVWKPQLEPIFDSITSSFDFQEPVYPKAMLARLAAGHAIDRHVDGAGSNLCTHKIHIPIQTNPEAIFSSNGDAVHLREGVAYEVNNIAPHYAENFGTADRIHLVFEVFDGAQ